MPYSWFVLLKRSRGPLTLAPHSLDMTEKKEEQMAVHGWRRLLRKSGPTQKSTHSPASTDSIGDYRMRPQKWGMGILNDKETDEVPGKFSPVWD